MGCAFERKRERRPLEEDEVCRLLEVGRGRGRYLWYLVAVRYPLWFKQPYLRPEVQREAHRADLLPLLLSFVSLYGIMALSGIKFAFVNIIAIPLLVGIGIDKAVHISHRYLIEGKTAAALVAAAVFSWLFCTWERNPKDKRLSIPLIALLVIAVTPAILGLLFMDAA